MIAMLDINDPAQPGGSYIYKNVRMSWEYWISGSIYNCLALILPSLVGKWQAAGVAQASVYYLQCYN